MLVKIINIFDNNLIETITDPTHLPIIGDHIIIDSFEYKVCGRTFYGYDTIKLFVEQINNFY